MSRQSIIALLDPESAAVGALVSIVQLLVGADWVHDFLQWIDRNIPWFKLEEFLESGFGWLYDIVVSSVAHIGIIDLVKSIVEEEADEIAITVSFCHFNFLLDHQIKN